MYGYSTEQSIKNIEKMLKQIQDDSVREKYAQQYNNINNSYQASVQQSETKNTHHEKISDYLFSREELDEFIANAEEDCYIDPTHKGKLWDTLYNYIEDFFKKVTMSDNSNMAFNLSDELAVSDKIVALKKMIDDNELILFIYDRISEMFETLASYYEAVNYKDSQISILNLRIEFRKDGVRSLTKIKQRLQNLNQIMTKCLEENKVRTLEGKESFNISVDYFRSYLKKNGNDRENIKKTYRTLIKSYHPDTKNNDELAEIIAKYITMAYGEIMAELDA